MKVSSLTKIIEDAIEQALREGMYAGEILEILEEWQNELEDKL